MEKNKLNNEALDSELKFDNSDNASDSTIGKKLRGADFLKKESKLSLKGRGAITEIYKKKNRFPIALDIIIAILTVALIGGAIIGGYYTFVYFSDSSDVVTAEYYILTEYFPESRISKGNDVYIDDGSKTYFVGSIVDFDKNIEVEGKHDDGEGQPILIRIRATLEYKAQDGYSVYGHKIAVGNEMDIRIGSDTYSGTVVEFNKVS